MGNQGHDSRGGLVPVAAPFALAEARNLAVASGVLREKRSVDLGTGNWTAGDGVL